jgi:hypothetical protein
MYLHAFLTSALDGGCGQLHAPVALPPRERVGWVGHKSLSGRGSEKKNSQPLPGLEPPVIQLVFQRCTTEGLLRRCIEKKSLDPCPCQASNFSRSARSLVTIVTELPRPSLGLGCSCQNMRFDDWNFMPGLP